MNEGRHIDEITLISRFRDGDKAAFAILVNEHRAHLFTYLVRLTFNRMVAEDLMQDTLLKVWRARHSFKPEENFRAWLFRIAYNVSVDYKRKSHRVQFVDNYPEQVDDKNPHALFENHEQNYLLEKGLETLTEPQRQVFLLRQHSDMSFKEIAGLMDQSINTVLSHMNYAMKKLQKYMQECYDVQS